MRRLVVLIAVVLGLSTLAGVPPAVADPQPGECEALTSEQVQDPETRITGSTPADHTAYDCYVLPDAAGAVYVVNDFLESWAIVTVHDAEGTQICDRFDRQCHLVGDAPFTLRVGYLADTAWEYEVQALRVSGGNDCPHHELTGFGPDGEFFTTDEDWSTLVCWSVDVPRGRLMIPTNSNVSLYDGEGDVVCQRDPFWQEDEPYLCATPDSGPGVVVVRTKWFDEEVIPIVAVHRTEGCSGGIGTTWDAAPVQVPRLGLVVDCRPFDAKLGQRVFPAVQDASHVVVDSTGLRACRPVPWESVEPPTHLGCELTGEPPYRMLSWGAGSANPGPTYPVVVRDLTTTQGCPVVQPRPYGSAPTDRHPGNVCRQFVATAGQSLFVRSIQLASAGPLERGTWVVDDAGRIACIGDQVTGSTQFPYLPCDNLPAGRYRTITDPVSSDHVTMLHDKRSAAGCTPGPPGLTLVKRPVEPGRLDCYLIDQPPRGALGFVHPMRDSEALPLPAQLLRADGTENTGESGCPMRWCLSAADGPHRLLVGSGEQAEHEFALYTLADLTDCAQAGPGRTDLRLTASAPFACVRLDELDNWTELIKVRSDAGFQFAYGINGLAFCDANGFGAAGYEDLYCHANLGIYTTTFIGVLGFGGRQTVSFIRDKPQVRNRERPELRGAPVVGRTVRADPGRWSPKDPLLTYQWTLNGRAIPRATKPTLRLRSGFVGKTLKVRVTADLPRYFSRTAASAPVAVRRR